MSPRPHTFASRLLTSRHALGLSKSALAREVGVSPTCVWNWEEGNTEPRSENFAALARALKVSVGYLENGDSGVSAHPISGAQAPQAQSLGDTIAEAKDRISALAGISSDKVRITLDY